MSGPERPTTMTEVVIAGRGLTKQYRGRTVVDRLDVQAAAHEIVGLLGPNGAGKTTAFRMMAGLVRPDTGSVSLAGRDVTQAPLHRRAQLGLGYLPQEPSVFRRLTVRDNLDAVLALRPGLAASERRHRTEEMLERFDLTDRAGLVADRLSGGERRRLELARCLVVRPTCLLLDEPFAGIDPIGVADLQTRLRGLRAEALAILITDHNAHATLPLCDRAYLVRAGNVVEHGTRVELAQSDVARAAYLGSAFRLDISDR